MRLRLKLFLAAHWRFFGFLACLFFAVALAGCTVAAWMTTANQIIPLATTMVGGVLSLIASLVGKTLSPTAAAKLTTVIKDVEAGLGDIGTMVAEYQANPSPTTLGNIESGTKAVLDNLKQFLDDVGVPPADDPALTKIVAILTLVISEVESFASLLPVFNATSVPGTKLTITIPMTSQAAKNAYNDILATPTGNKDVDSALSRLKKL